MPLRESSYHDSEETPRRTFSATPALGKRWWIPSAFAILSLALLLVVPAVIDLRVTRVRRQISQGSDRARVLLNDLEAAFASQLIVSGSALASKDPPEFAKPNHLEADEAELRSAVTETGPTATALYDSLDRRLAVWRESSHDGSPATSQQGLELLAAAERLDSALAIVSAERRAEARGLERYFVLTPSVLAPMALIAILIVVSSGRQMRHFALLAQEERAEVVRASETRAALLRGVTHDVKNPLGAASGYAQLLEEGLAGPLEPSQLKMVRRIRSLVQAAVQTVTDLLELARVDGRLQIEYAACDLAAIVNGVVDDHEGMALARRIEIAVRAQHTPLVTDPLRVRQVLTNLLSNAIKYSLEGGKVSVSIVSSSDPELARVGVEVRDTGVGIPAELQARVFQEFFRVRTGDAYAPHSNGLGLAISRRLAQLLGGDVQFADGDAGGSVFTLWLPSTRQAAR
jgi:signal transduction histidine kinase